MPTFAVTPRGPFSLAAAQSFAGGFPAGIGGGSAAGTSLVMAFPLEPAWPDRAGDTGVGDHAAGGGAMAGSAGAGGGPTGGWGHSAAVELRQAARDGEVTARVETTGDPSRALAQALRCVSLDVDGSGWPDVGRRDPVIGRLQAGHDDLRPVCFYSAYEAATSFVIGQRIARAQAARIKARVGELAGDRVAIDGVDQVAFPRPERLLEVDVLPGLSAEKLDRIHGLARAALDGRLATERLRGLPAPVALDELRNLRGVGDFTAQGILLRGCGLVDELPADVLSDEVIGDLYADELAAGRTAAEITDRWRPYRMWATVLLRVGWGRRQERPPSYRRGS